jgi:hypothetical protein
MTYTLRANRAMTGSVKDFAGKATDSESQHLVLRSLWITYPLGLKKAHETLSLAVTLGDHLHPKQGLQEDQYSAFNSHNNITYLLVEIGGTNQSWCDFLILKDDLQASGNVMC